MPIFTNELLMRYLSGRSRRIPAERISHVGIQPYAFDQVNISVAASEAGLLLSLQYQLGPNFDAILKRLHPEEAVIKARGGLLFFGEPVPWELVGQAATGRPISVGDALQAVAAASSPSFQDAFLERLTRLTIQVPEDDPEALEFCLQFGSELTLEERVPRTDWSDIYPWPPDRRVPDAPQAPLQRRRGRPPKGGLVTYVPSPQTRREHTTQNEGPLRLDPGALAPEIPRERIIHEGIEPIAFDGIRLRVASTPSGFRANLDYELGPNFKAALRDRFRKQDRCVVNGGILSFKDLLSQEWVDRQAGTSTFRLGDLMRVPTFTPAVALQALLLERLALLTIRIADDTNFLEFRLRLDAGYELTQRVARVTWSDIYPLPTGLPRPGTTP